MKDGLISNIFCRRLCCDLEISHFFASQLGLDQQTLDGFHGKKKWDPTLFAVLDGHVGRCSSEVKKSRMIKEALAYRKAWWRIQVIGEFSWTGTLFKNYVKLREVPKVCFRLEGSLWNPKQGGTPDKIIADPLQQVVCIHTGCTPLNWATPLKTSSQCLCC